ncbi:MAG: hypothetical protein QOH26_1524 [Actinomycetota bacterium]|jgi:uncharacterized protein (TIGR00369 family)|nr:hypothetical protein [Actinomycetota bacterium]
MTEFEAGENFQLGQLESGPPVDGPHVWRTLGYERVVWEPGHQVIEWKATEDYAFPAFAGYIVHGGLVSTLLDTAMGGAAWTLLDRDEAFLTSNLNVEFMRSAHPGLLRGSGKVVNRTKRAIFCSSELFDEDGKLLAAARCTQIILPGKGPAGRPHRNER